jgi:hypothetical protein
MPEGAEDKRAPLITFCTFSLLSLLCQLGLFQSEGLSCVDQNYQQQEQEHGGSQQVAACLPLAKRE